MFFELLNLGKDIEKITKSKSTNDMQMETFLRNLEKRRYNILSEVKLYNNTVEYKTDKIKNISYEYKAEVIDNTLKIYIPEPMPSYRNLKTHAYKNILLNITEVTKPYKNMFNEKVFVYIKIFDNIKGWDIDNKYIKPIFDSLISNKIIEDDQCEREGSNEHQIEESQKDEMLDRLNKDLEFIEGLFEVNVDGIDPLYHVIDLPEYLREDVQGPTLDNEVIPISTITSLEIKSPSK